VEVSEDDNEGRVDGGSSGGTTSVVVVTKGYEVRLLGATTGFSRLLGVLVAASEVFSVAGQLL